MTNLNAYDPTGIFEDIRYTMTIPRTRRPLVLCLILMPHFVVHRFRDIHTVGRWSVSSDVVSECLGPKQVQTRNSRLRTDGLRHNNTPPPSPSPHTPEAYCEELALQGM